MPTDEQRKREQFEAWRGKGLHEAVRRQLFAPGEGGAYDLPKIEEAWAAWQARDVEVQALREALRQIAESPADEPMWHIRAIARAALAGEEGTPE